MPLLLSPPSLLHRLLLRMLRPITASPRLCDHPSVGYVPRPFAYRVDHTGQNVALRGHACGHYGVS